MMWVGLNRLASLGITSYLNALVDSEIDETVVKSAIYFGYLHQLDDYMEFCTSQTGEEFVLGN